MKTVFDTNILISGHFWRGAPHDSWVSDDPDDDKFIDAALFGNAGVIVSGDRHLLDFRPLRVSRF